jgi:sortase A
MVTANDQGIRQAVVAGESRRRKLLLAIRQVLLVVGISLLGVFVGARIHSALLSRMAVLSFSASQQAPTSKAREEGAPDANVDFTLWSDKRINAYKQSLAERWARPLAVLHVPKIHLEAPVLDGTDDLTLNRGLGHVASTPKPGEPGNVAIAGHRDGFFRGLKDVGVGDRLDLSLPNRTDTYVVDSITIVDPSDVSVLEPTTEPSLTLITCYPFFFIGSAPHRYIVHASIVHSEPLNRNASGPGDSR